MATSRLLKKLRPSRLYAQLILGVAGILVILMILLVMVLMNRQKKFFLELNHDRAIGLSTTLANTADSYVISYELAGLQKLVSTYKNNPGLQYAIITSTDGTVLAHTDKKYLGLKAVDSVSNKLRSINTTQTLVDNDSMLDIATPIINHDEIIGWARIGLSQEYIEPALKEIRKNGLLFILISLIIGSIFAIIVAGRLSKGLQKLVSVAKKIKEGNRDIRVGASKSFEIAELGTAFNQMLDDINANEKRVIERESQLTTFFESIDGAASLLDVEKKYVLFNKRFIYDHQLLTNQDPYVGEVVYDLFPEDIRESRLKILDSVLEGNKEVIEVDYFSNGQRICYRTSFNPVITHGKVTGISTYSLDLTKSKEAELEIIKLNRLYHFISQMNELILKLDSKEEIFAEACRIAVDVGKFQMAWIGTYDELNDKIEPTTWSGLEEGFFMSIGESGFKVSTSSIPSARAIRTRSHFYYNDIAHDSSIPDAVKKEMLKRNYLSAISLPIFVDSKIVAAFVLLMSEPFFFNEGEVKLMKDVTDNITYALDKIRIKALQKKTELEMQESEEKFRMSFMTSQDVFYIGTLNEGRIIDVNDSFYNLFGYTREESIGRTSTELELYVYPEERAKMVAELKANGHVKDLELTGKKRNGELMIISVTVNLWQMNNEQVIMAVIRDITEQKESNLKFKNLVEKSLVGVYIFAKGKYVYVNPKFEEILGYTEEEMLNMEDVRSIIDENYNPDALLEWRKKIDTGIIDDFHIELRYKRKDGTVIWAEVYCGETLYKGSKVILGTLQDITERKNAEATIKEQAETFEAIIENTNESIWLLSPDLKVLQFNKTAKDRLLLQRGKEIYIGANFEEFLNIGTEEIFFSMFHNAVSGKYAEQESHQKNIHGQSFWLRTKMYPVYDTLERLMGVAVLFENITDRKKAENELRESEEKFRSLVEKTLVGVFILQDEQIVYANPGFENISGYTRQELLHGMNFQQLIYKEDVNWVKDNYELRISGEKPSDEYLLRAVKKDGTLIYIDIIVSRIVYNNKPAVIGSVIDKTNQMEEEKRIGRAVIDAQEKERTEIGMELHDNVKQLMAVSLMSLDFVKRVIDNKTESIEIINSVRGYITDAIDELRRLSHQLAPVVDDEKGTLIEKVEKLINDSKIVDKMEVFLDIDELDKPIDAEIQLAFYRIMQEQFNNIIKYSKASGVLIRVKGKDGKLKMTIKDDGVGFDTTLKKDGIGLENIRRRINTLNGEVKIISSPGEGCEVQVLVPFN